MALTLNGRRCEKGAPARGSGKDRENSMSNGTRASRDYSVIDRSTATATFRKGKVGKWVGHQRTAYRTDSLAQDRIDRLNSIGFAWKQRDKVPWETRFDQLAQYKTQHGDCNVPQSQGKLGTWVNNQRATCKNGKLSQDLIDQLNEIGFKWALIVKGPTVPWETRFKQLVQYKAKHGDCNVPDGQGKLGNWVRKQRGAYKAGSLAQDRIDRLNVMGFEWTPPIGGSRKRKAPPSTRNQSLSRKDRVPSPSSTNVNYRSLGDGPRGGEPNGFKGEGRIAASVLSLKVSSKRSDHNCGTVSDDEVDEIGAIYDQVIQQRQSQVRRR